MRVKPSHLSDHYLRWAEYWFALDMHHSVWFYLMAAWCYDEEDARAGDGWPDTEP